MEVPLCVWPGIGTAFGGSRKLAGTRLLMGVNETHTHTHTQTDRHTHTASTIRKQNVPTTLGSRGRQTGRAAPGFCPESQTRCSLDPFFLTPSATPLSQQRQHQQPPQPQHTGCLRGGLSFPAFQPRHLPLGLAQPNILNFVPPPHPAPDYHPGSHVHRKGGQSLEAPVLYPRI